MIKFIQSLHILPRWIILIIDVAILAFSLTLAYFIRFDFVLEEFALTSMSRGFPMYILVNLLAIFFTLSYAGIIRHTGLQDGYRIAHTTTLGIIFTLIVNYVYLFLVGTTMIPLGVIIIAYLNSLIFLIGYRILVKYIFSFYSDAVKNKDSIVIFGSAESAQLTKQIIDSDIKSNVKVVAFLEDDIRKVGKVLNGVRIYDANKFDAIIKEFKVKEFIISQPDLALERKNQLVDHCLKYNIKIRSIPPAEKWIRGELSYNQIKSLNIEDLLGRESIKIDSINLKRELEGKSVLISGAAGSIGSELARQVILYKPKLVVLLDQAESALFDVINDIAANGNTVKVVPIVADVTDSVRMRRLFETYLPDIVLHAAAYKHVPLMEDNPSEAVKCNVFGTKNLADLSIKYKVKKFVMISTDKAVNPTSVMGASKRIAEIYVQSLSHQDSVSKRTAFITTRFGNVLGSNGSVIPLFKKQIEKRQTITVTHEDVTRFFMTIPEACQLVLEAGSMGNGGEIYIFDMGKSVKVVDLAKKMIQLSGLELDKDIDIKYTGLRPGEKLYEELLNNEENTLPTHHPKIMIARITNTNDQPLDLPLYFKQLEEAIGSGEDEHLVKIMKSLVPEYISSISRFEHLDVDEQQNGHPAKGQPANGHQTTLSQEEEFYP